MNQLKILVAHDYNTSIRTKSFWIITFLFPILIMGFGIFIGFLAEDSSSLTTVANPVSPDKDSFTIEKGIGMIFGCFLTFFIILYGAQIFNSVKAEKTNRIMEIIATSVPGRTMMLAKIISVGLIGITQILCWLTLIIIGILFLNIFAQFSLPADFYTSPLLWKSLIWGTLYFVFGYIFYASLFAAIGALTDKNNENQEYVSVLTFILLAAFYISEFAVDHSDSILSQWCTYIPFTASSVGIVRTISGELSFFGTLLSLIVLIGFCALSITFAGKLYRSGILLKGKKLSPRDFVTFIRMK